MWTAARISGCLCFLDGKPIPRHARYALLIDQHQRKTREFIVFFFFFFWGCPKDSPASTPLGYVAGDPNTTNLFGHVFSTLTFDGVSVTHPPFMSTPDLIGDRGSPTTSTDHTRVRPHPTTTIFG